MVRTSFQSIAGRSTRSDSSSRTELCICPDGPIELTSCTPAWSHAALTALTVPCHQPDGSCSAHPGLGTDTSRGDSDSPTTVPHSSTTRALTAVVPTSIPT